MDDSVSGWMQLGVDVDGEAAYDNSGTSVSLSADGNTVAIGSPKNDDNGNSSGHVRVFVLEWWWMEGYLLAVVDQDHVLNKNGIILLP